MGQPSDVIVPREQESHAEERVPPERTEERTNSSEDPVSLSDRCGLALGQALAKRAKASHPLIRRPFSGGGEEACDEAQPPEGVIVPVGEGFQRGRLTEWM